MSMKRYLITRLDYESVTPDNPAPCQLGQGYEIMAFEKDIADICELMSDYFFINGQKFTKIKANYTELES